MNTSAHLCHSHRLFSVLLLTLLLPLSSAKVCDWWWEQDRQLGLLKFIGFWLGDGHLATQNGLVVIGQKKEAAVQWLEKLLDEVFPRWWFRNGDVMRPGMYKYYVRCPPLYKYLRLMAVGPPGYNARDPTQLRSYPHFTAVWTLEVQERQSDYYRADSAGYQTSTWTQRAMYRAMTGRRMDNAAASPASLTRTLPSTPVSSSDLRCSSYSDTDGFDTEAIDIEPPLVTVVLPDGTETVVHDYDVGPMEDDDLLEVPYGEVMTVDDQSKAEALIAAGAIIWWNNGKWLIINGHWFYLKRWLGDVEQIANVYSKLSRQQAIALLEGFCRADGNWSEIRFDSDQEPTGQWRCSNSSFPLIDHLQLIGQLAGAAVDLKLHTKAGKSTTIDDRTVTFSVDHWALHFTFTKSKRGIPFQTAPLAEPVMVAADDSDGCGYYQYNTDRRVYCITVEGNGNFLTQRLSIKPIRSGNECVKAHSMFIGNCLSKDMSSKFDLFRANSIRVLASIMDASMVGQMERFLKQAIVDKNPFIMASALSAGQQLYGTSPEVVKRWLNEITEALNNKSKMVQYHALALLYRIRAADKLALSKVVTGLARHNPSIAGSPMAQLLHIRIITSLLLSTPAVQQGSAAGAIHAELLKYVTDCLHAKHYVVMYEAARALVRLDHLLTAQQLVPAINVIQEMLTSTIAAHRFAAVKTLSEVVVRYPLLVNPCVTDLEHCINDPNRSIATLAITTLLKTGVESNVDRLMKSISGFMTDISDEFKIVLVDAIRSLCLKFPHKFPALMNFLASSLREEGGYKYKKAIVDAMLVMINDIKEAQELGLECFCEFIEDCVDGEALVSMADGTSRPLKEVRAGDRVLAWREGGLVPSEVTRAVAKGAQPCVELLFSDGRTLACTADHRILTADARWVRAGELRVGEDAVTAGVEYALSSTAEAAHSTWKLDLCDSLGSTLDMQSTRSKSLAFARLLGYSQHSGDDTELAMDVAHRLDAQDVLADIDLLSGKQSTAPLDNAAPYRIALSKELAAAMLAVGVAVGKQSDERVSTSIPSFLLDPTCPLPIVREFLGGLFGSNVFELVLTNECHVSHSGDMQTDMLRSQLVCLLDRCGVVADEVGITPSEADVSAKKAATSNSELVLHLNPSTISLFAHCVGFRYSCQKAQRLTAAASFSRSLPDAFELTVNPFIVPDTHIDSIALTSFDDKATTDKHLPPLAADRLTGTVHENATAQPVYRLTLIGRRDVGATRVYDITVPGGTSFVAGGIVVHNCEFPELSVRILHVLGERGPLTANPAKYIRFIFNRVILETASVRSAAVSSLAKFGSNVPSLTENIIVLLQRCLTDNDDEVRERAVYYVSMLSKDIGLARSCINQRPPAPLYQLEGSLLAYLARSHVNHPFSLQKDLINVGPDPDLLDEAGKLGSGSAAPSTHTSPSLAPSAAGASPSAVVNGEPVNAGLDMLHSIPELAALGPIFKSCAPVSLTEAESEYVVVCVKHILPHHVVFQFNVTNNMEQQQLDSVSVEMECDTDGWVEELSIPEPSLQYSIAGVTVVVWKRADDAYTSGAMTCTLHFKVREVDDGEVIGEEGDGVADEYQLEEIEVVESDFMRAGPNIALVEFKRQWEELGETVELVKKYSLGLDNLQAAVTAVLDLLGMQACESSGVVAEGARTHAVNLTGQWFGGVNVLARAGFGLDARHGVTLKIAVRSPNQRVNQMLTNAIR